MEFEKDEGKGISGVDEGGNKIVVYEEYNVNSQRVKMGPGPCSLMLAPPVSVCSNFFSQASVSAVKRKLGPIITRMNECPQSSHGSGGLLRPSNYRNPSSSSSLMVKAKCISVPPPCGAVGYINRSTNENDLAVSSFLQTGKVFNHGNLKKEKFDAFGSASSSKLHCSTRSVDDQTMRLHQNLGEESTRNETNRSSFPLCLQFKSLDKSKSVADGVSTLSGPSARQSTSAEKYSARASPQAKDCDQWTKISSINDRDESLLLKMGDCVKTSDSYIQNSLLGLDLTPDEVARVIGQRVFLKARKTMLDQQKIFALQMFELHRLITVQKHMARSRQIMHENSFDSNKPSLKFPPINNLLYVAPLDPSPPIAKPKINHGTECEAEALRGLLAEPLTPKSLPSSSIDPKLGSWCFPVPTGNQWLVPVRSPSEGLIYKPYPGLCFPNSGFMAPVYGNCVSLLGGGGATHAVPQSMDHGSGGFCSYLESAGQTSDLDKASSILSQQRSNGCEVSESRPNGRLEGSTLSLFPTTPLLQATRNEQRVQAIKVVPHTRTSASASAARIFQSIQEERRKQE